MNQKVWDNWSAVLAGLGLFIMDMLLNNLIWSASPPVGFVFSVVILLMSLYMAYKLDLWQGWSVFKETKTWLWVVSGLILNYAVKYLGYLILLMEHGQAVNPQNQQNILEAPIPSYLLFLVVVLQGPLFEEVLIRGILMGRLFVQKPLLGLFLSSFIFGFLHGPQDMGSWMIYGGMGLLLGFVYWKTGRLEVPLLVHSLSNLFAFLLLSGLIK